MSGGDIKSSRLAKKLGKINLSEETEMTLRRIHESKNVLGVVVVNKEGMPVMSSLDSTLTVQYADLISNLIGKAQSVIRTLDPTNGLDFFRLRSKRSEIMIAPDNDYVLIVIQGPTEANEK